MANSTPTDPPPTSSTMTVEITKPPQGNAAMDRSFLTANIADVVQELTLDEKIILLSGKNWWETVPIPRVNVPSIKVTDGPNGARGGSFFKATKAVAFPNATCVAAAFSEPLVKEAGGLLAEEVRARGALCLLAPTVNIQRSPLGGRAFESFSEDPTLSGQVAAAYVNGLQEAGVSATIKHFICNDQEHERNGQDSIVDDRPLREVYLRPFQIAAAKADPWAYMTSYNKLNGTHCSENPWLLKELLRKEWGFDGLVMSDWYGTYSVSESINAGMDLEMPGPGIWRAPRLVKHSLVSHKIDPREIDARAATILGWVQKLAKLNADFVYAAPKPEHTRMEAKDEDSKLLRRLAGEGVVVLKNENEILPIKKGKVAVIGPNAKARVITGGGSAHLRAAWSVSPYEGLAANKPADVELDYALGCVGEKYLPILGEDFTAMNGEKGFTLNHYAIKNGVQDEKATVVDDVHDVSDMLLADLQHPVLGFEFVTELTAKFTSPITGQYEFGAIVSGQGWLYLDDKLIIDNSRKQVMSGHFFGNGTREERGVADVEKGKVYTLRFVHDSRRPPDRAIINTPFVINAVRIGAFPKIDADQAITEAVAAAKAADTVVLVAGLNKDWESEGYDRPTLGLPYRSDELIAAVAAANPNTIVVLQAGSAIAMPWKDSVAGIVHAWYGGNECGNGIADVIYGTRNPSGRLPLSFPKEKRDIAAALNYKSAQTRTRYEEGIWVGYKHHNARGIAPLFPFGHGLSYTTFEYKDLEVVAPTGTPAAGDWKLTARVTVTNTGKVAGDHSVHFYTAPPAETATSTVHPEHALQGFTKVYDLAPGASETVEVVLDKYAVSHWDERDNLWRAERGVWNVKVGVDAQTMVAQKEFEIAHEMTWIGL